MPGPSGELPAGEEQRVKELIIEQYYNFVSSADSLYRASNEAALQFQNLENPLRVAASSVDYGLEALSAATFFLGAATNSLLTLRLSSIGQVTFSDGSTHVERRITINGTAGLVRQALECAARAHWLTSPANPDELSRRGFAAIWADAYEAVRYARAIGSPELSEKERGLARLLEEGRARGLISENNGKPKPTTFLLSATDIIKKLRFTPGHVDGLRELLGSNVNCGEWVYRWLSGMAHGQGWAHPRQATAIPEGSLGMHYTKPDWARLTLSTSLAVRLIHTVLESLGRESPYVEIATRL